jgi:hypothetical protein
MALKAYLSVEKDVLLPAVLGLTVVAITVVTLYLLKRRKVAGTEQGGTEYVTSLDGQTVRRSTRCERYQQFTTGRMFRCFRLGVCCQGHKLHFDVPQVAEVSSQVEP